MQIWHGLSSGIRRWCIGSFHFEILQQYETMDVKYRSEDLMRLEGPTYLTNSERQWRRDAESGM